MLELHVKPQIEELSKEIDYLSSGKAPGTDGIPAEIIKSGKPIIWLYLDKLLCSCWDERAVPQDMHDENSL